MRRGTCIHFNGTQHNSCEAGVNYIALVGRSGVGWARQLPCFTLDPIDQHATCEKYREPTEQELADFEAQIQERIEMYRKASPLVIAFKKEFKGHSGVVIKECPVCGGKLHMSITAYNGHVHGQCETRGCLSWME